MFDGKIETFCLSLSSFCLSQGAAFWKRAGKWLREKGEGRGGGTQWEGKGRDGMGRSPSSLKASGCLRSGNRQKRKIISISCCSVWANFTDFPWCQEIGLKIIIICFPHLTPPKAINVRLALVQGGIVSSLSLQPPPPWGLLGVWGIFAESTIVFSLTELGSMFLFLESARVCIPAKTLQQQPTCQSSKGTASVLTLCFLYFEFLSRLFIVAASVWYRSRIWSWSLSECP